MYCHWLKRILDVLLACLGILILAPLLLTAALLVLATSRGPIFFAQTRVGRNGRTFLLYKFRSMYDRPRTALSEIFVDNQEVTGVGYFLRRFKIDELPQLWNVIKGDMSLIGPRPCLPERVSEFDSNGIVRLDVRPGLTGLAQVNGNIH